MNSPMNSGEKGLQKRLKRKKGESQRNFPDKRVILLIFFSFWTQHTFPLNPKTVPSSCVNQTFSLPPPKKAWCWFSGSESAFNNPFSPHPLLLKEVQYSRPGPELQPEYRKHTTRTEFIKLTLGIAPPEKGGGGKKKQEQYPFQDLGVTI